MTYTVVLQPDAENEIIEAFFFIQADSPMNAERWLREIYKTINSLDTLPKRFELARESADFPYEIRQAIYKSHRILYTIKRAEVRILHVRHAAQKNLPHRGENHGHEENN